MPIDIAKEIRRCVDTGSVAFGTEQGLKDLRDAKAKLVLVASNCPELERHKVNAFAAAASVPVHALTIPNTELGALCGKPFAIAVLSVREAGKSKILEINAGANQATNV